MENLSVLLPTYEQLVEEVYLVQEFLFKWVQAATTMGLALRFSDGAFQLLKRECIECIEKRYSEILVLGPSKRNLIEGLCEYCEMDPKVFQKKKKMRIWLGAGTTRVSITTRVR